MSSRPPPDGFDFDAFVRDRPWTFSAVVALAVALVAFFTGGSVLGSFVGFFLVTALLTLAYGRLTGGSERGESERSDADRRSGSNGEGDALARLRERYAEGKIDEDEFERRVERLLLAEDDDEAEAYLRERES